MLSIMVTTFMAFWSTAEASEGWGEYTYYLGDLHAHSGASLDGGSSDLGDEHETCGAIDDIVDTAIWNGLDFLAMSDHSNGNPASTEVDYLFVQSTTLEGHAPKDGFIVLPAAEVFFTLGQGQRLGHKNLILFGSDAELESLTLQDAQPVGTANSVISDCDHIRTWMNQVQSNLGPALIIPHHPALKAPMPTDWSCHHPEFSPAVEIYSRHGNSEYEDTTYDIPWSEIEHNSTVQAAIDPDTWNHRLGFVGGTDSHDTRPGKVCAEEGDNPNLYWGGLTVSVIPSDVEYSRKAIYHSIVNRDTYATSGPLIPVSAEYYSGGAYLGSMGDEVGIPNGQPLNVIVETPYYHSQFVYEVVLRSIGEEIPMVMVEDGEWSVMIAADQIPPLLYPVLKINGAAWYMEHGGTCRDGGDDDTERIWLSPTWFEPTTGDLDNDGTTWEDGDCDDGDPNRHPYSFESCTNGVDDDCDGKIDILDSDCYLDSTTVTETSPPEPYEPDVDPSIEEIGPTTGGARGEAAGIDTPDRYSGGCSSLGLMGSWLWFIGFLPLLIRRAAA